MDVDELIARESIRDLVARYNSNGDAGRVNEVLALFHSDAVMEIAGRDGTTRRFEGLAEIERIFTGARHWLATSAGHPAYVRHFVATHQIDLTVDAAATNTDTQTDTATATATSTDTAKDTATATKSAADTATGRAYFAVITPVGLDHWGRYLDRYRLGPDSRWRFAARTVITDGYAQDSMYLADS